MILLEGRECSFSYPLKDGAHLPVLNHFSLSLAEGEIVSLLGPSGCGKTTALNLLSGFIKADSGSVFYREKELSSPFPAGQMIFQDSNQLLPWLTVEENILFPVKRAPFPGMRLRVDGILRDKLETILGQIALTEYRDYHPARLSGGMKQRCALGRALMADAEILYMDEPFGALDSPSRRDLQALLLDLWRKRTLSVLFVTHDIPEALTLSDRILLFNSPGSPVREMTAGLERPRDRKSSAFREMEWEIYSSLSDGGTTL